MKVTIIHGQSHKGSTYHISKILADKIGGEVKEFFLPRDFGEFCVGCTQCFRKSETLCPHYEKISPSVNKWLYKQEQGYIQSMQDVTLKEIAEERIQEFTTALKKYIL